MQAIKIYNSGIYRARIIEKVIDHNSHDYSHLHDYSLFVVDFVLEEQTIRGRLTKLPYRKTGDLNISNWLTCAVSKVVFRNRRVKTVTLENFKTLMKQWLRDLEHKKSLRKVFEDSKAEVPI